jgi:hypothetical protein
MNTQPSLATGAGVTWDALLGADLPIETKSIVLDSYGSATDALYSHGRLLNKDKDGKYRPLATAETTVALNDVKVVDDFGTTTVQDYDFVLAHPPIPGTVRVVTVDQDTTNVVLDAGTDNGEGIGRGAGGWFTVDYMTGVVHVHFASAPSDNDDLTYSYKHHSPITNGANIAESGMPVAILAEDIPGADVVAGDVTTIAYVAGEFRQAALLGYSAGYESHLNVQGIYTK